MISRSAGLMVTAVTAAVLSGCGGSPPSVSATAQPAPINSATGFATASSPGSNPSPAAATESNPPGDIPDNQVYVAYTTSDRTATVKVPEGWGRTGSGAVVTFGDKLNRITVGTARTGSAPTVASVSRDTVPQLRSATTKFAAASVIADRRAGQPVVVVRYQGDSAQDPVTGKVVRDAFERYIFYRNGIRLDVTLSGPTSADNVDPWRIVSDSVRWRS